jgi:anti-sigma regulatory factor (Ser/Thr protein kinase)
MTADHSEFHGDHVGPHGDWLGPDGDHVGPHGDWPGPDGDQACPDCQEDTGLLLRLALPPDVPTVRLARQATRDTLAAWQLSHLEEAAVLLVSELVTNALRHARDTGAIGLELASVGTRLRMEVQDGDPHWRLKPSSPDDDESGFGFVLVDSLAGRWGIRRVCAGKAVWVELDA